MTNLIEELPFPHPEFKEKWEEWIAYRKERKLPSYKPIGLKKTFSKILRESSGDYKEAIDMLEYSMENNYQGIFKRNKNGANRQTSGTDHQRTLGSKSAGFGILTDIINGLPDE